MPEFGRGIAGGLIGENRLRERFTPLFLPTDHGAAMRMAFTLFVMLKTRFPISLEAWHPDKSWEHLKFASIRHLMWLNDWPMRILRHRAKASLDPLLAVKR